jgi:hypothetical protein
MVEFDVVREIETELGGGEAELEWAYGFAAGWELQAGDEAEHEEEIAAAAAERLYGSIKDYPKDYPQ